MKTTLLSIAVAGAVALIAPTLAGASVYQYYQSPQGSWCPQYYCGQQHMPQYKKKPQQSHQYYYPHQQYSMPQQIMYPMYPSYSSYGYPFNINVNNNTNINANWSYGWSYPQTSSYYPSYAYGGWNYGW